MAGGTVLIALRCLAEAQARPDKAMRLRRVALRAARESGMRIEDFERALFLASVTPREFLRHENAVAVILAEADAPVRARFVGVSVAPAGRPDERPDLAAWALRLGGGAGQDGQERTCGGAADGIQLDLPLLRLSAAS